jgi:hypothetical protein
MWFEDFRQAELHHQLAAQFTSNCVPPIPSVNGERLLDQKN